MEYLPQLDSGKARDAVGKAVGVSGKSIAAEIKIRAGKRMGQLLKTALPNCRWAASFNTD